MEKYILFTAVGTTDPISNYRDGAILHICRKYKPEKIYLFFSKEMATYHNLDNRYFASIEKLVNTYEGYQPQKYELVYENLTDVHKFDEFYNVFESQVLLIQKENPEHTILLNISSGTPAMKNALNLIATLNDDTIKAIQVRGPFEKSNPKKDDISKYDIQAEWECNEDNNEETFIDRTSIEKGLNLTARIKKEIILKHIGVYDYHAALEVAKDIRPSMNDTCFKLLKAACNRLLLNEEGVTDALRGTDIKLSSIKKKKDNIIIEYILWLQVKQKRKEYVDFIRGITPVVADLFENILKSKLAIKPLNFCVKKKIDDGNILYRVERSNLSLTEQGQEYLKVFDNSGYFRGGLNNSDLSSIHILALMEHYYKGESTSLLQTMKEIRTVETKVRNLAAHEIVSITDDWIYKRCEHSSSKILKKIKKLTEFSGINIKDSIWDSYDEMNDIIASYLI